jgi:hypothetical protein
MKLPGAQLSFCSITSRMFHSHLRVVAILAFVLFSTLTSIASLPVWLKGGWSHRVPVTIQHSGSVLPDHQVHVQLDRSFAFANAKPDGSDLRVTLADGITQAMGRRHGMSRVVLSHLAC